jgi:Transcriptional regulators, similar to M. xanthus CarD
MKKINLKNILKKTFNKNKKKSKKLKIKKKAVAKSLKIKKLKKINLNIPKKAKTSIKSENLRISKTNELKPEIKKIKKQETAKKEYKLKDYVVYPKHGVGQILSISSKTIGGIDVQCYNIEI